MATTAASLSLPSTIAVIRRDDESCASVKPSSTVERPLEWNENHDRYLREHAHKCPSWELREHLLYSFEVNVSEAWIAERKRELGVIVCPRIPRPEPTANADERDHRPRRG